MENIPMKVATKTLTFTDPTAVANDRLTGETSVIAFRATALKNGFSNYQPGIWFWRLFSSSNSFVYPSGMGKCWLQSWKLFWWYIFYRSRKWALLFSRLLQTFFKKHWKDKSKIWWIRNASDLCRKRISGIKYRVCQNWYDSEACEEQQSKCSVFGWLV